MPQEVDLPEEVYNGQVTGVKRAAVRKLQHELGISSVQLPLEKFKFLTRLHYCAADTDTYGAEAPWGEHEIDYILFIKTAVDLQPNPEEVDAVKYVSLTELQQMLSEGSGCKWSPWFRIIADKWLACWWRDLDSTLETNKYVDLTTVHHIL